MTKRSIAWLVLGSLLIGSVAGIWITMDGKYTARFSGEDLEKRVSAQLPKTHGQVTVKEVLVSLSETDMTVQLLADGRALGQSFTVEASGTGMPSYDPTKGAFYFAPSNLEIISLTMEGQNVAEKLDGAAERYLSNKDMREKVQSVLPGVAAWIKDHFPQAAAKALSSVPVYTLKSDLRGTIIRAGLESVKIENSQLVVVISFWKLSVMVGIWMLCLVAALGFAVALALNPGWGMAIIAFSSWS